MDFFSGAFVFNFRYGSHFLKMKKYFTILGFLLVLPFTRSVAFASSPYSYCLGGTPGFAGLTYAYSPVDNSSCLGGPVAYDAFGNGVGTQDLAYIYSTTPIISATGNSSYLNLHNLPVTSLGGGWYQLSGLNYPSTLHAGDGYSYFGFNGGTLEIPQAGQSPATVGDYFTNYPPATGTPVSPLAPAEINTPTEIFNILGLDGAYAVIASIIAGFLVYLLRRT